MAVSVLPQYLDYLVSKARELWSVATVLVVDGPPSGSLHHPQIVWIGSSYSDLDVDLWGSVQAGGESDTSWATLGAVARDEELTAPVTFTVRSGSAGALSDSRTAAHALAQSFDDALRADMHAGALGLLWQGVIGPVAVRQAQTDMGPFVALTVTVSARARL